MRKTPCPGLLHHRDVITCVRTTRFADTTVTASTGSWTSTAPAESTDQKATPRTERTPNTASTLSTGPAPTTRITNRPGTTATIRTGRWSTGCQVAARARPETSARRSDAARPSSTPPTTKAHPNRSGATARHNALPPSFRSTLS